MLKSDDSIDLCLRHDLQRAAAALRRDSAAYSDSNHGTSDIVDPFLYPFRSEKEQFESRKVESPGLHFEVRRGRNSEER